MAYTRQFNTIHFINSPHWVFHNYSQDYRVFTKYNVRNKYKRQLNLNATTTVIKNYKKQLITKINKLLVNFLFPSTDYLKPGTPFKNLNGGRVSNIISNIIGKTIVARMSSHTGLFLEILPMILPLLLLMCLTARCDNIKFHPLGRWQTSSLYQRSLH